MATPIDILLDTNLDVSSKYAELIERVMDGDSVYVRTKETLLAIFDDGAIDAGDKAQVLTQVMAQLNASVVSSAMSNALQWAAQEKQLYLQTLEIGYKLALLEAQTDGQNMQTAASLADKQLKQAQLRKQYGTPTFSVDADKDVATLGTDGKVDKEMALLDEEITNKQADAKVIAATENKVNAEVHKVVADTWTNYGTFNGYVLSENGITGVSKTSSHDTLSDNQREIADQQAKGYVYNAWSNAASSTASMIGVLLSSDNGGAVTAEDATMWRTAVNKLSAIGLPTQYATINDFTFINVTGAAINTPVTSNVITVSGAVAPLVAYSTGGILIVNGTEYANGVEKIVRNGDTIAVKHTTAATANTSKSTTATIGGKQALFYSQTAA